MAEVIVFLIVGVLHRVGRPDVITRMRAQLAVLCSICLRGFLLLDPGGPFIALVQIAVMPARSWCVLFVIMQLGQSGCSRPGRTVDAARGDRARLSS
jgi:hypothetical protein